MSTISTGTKRKAGSRTMTPARQRRDQERVRILAARLRVTTDKKQGKETPGWVSKLAGKSL